MFRRWWFVRLLSFPPEQAGRRPGRGRAERQRAERERRELVLGEWEVLRERLARIAAQRVTAAGELFRAAELRLPAEESSGAAQSAARAAYLWALETFEAAGRLLEQAEDPHTDLPDLAAAVVLAEQAVERLAAAHALLAGRRAEPPAVRCFYNPLHGPAVPAAAPGRPPRTAVRPAAPAAGPSWRARTRTCCPPCSRPGPPTGAAARSWCRTTRCRSSGPPGPPPPVAPTIPTHPPSCCAATTTGARRADAVLTPYRRRPGERGLVRAAR